MSPLTGVKPDSIGNSYDVAIGYFDAFFKNHDGSFGRTNMVGYVLAPGQKWQESTDLQDEMHIVQISTLSTDRFARYPKQSQGDWSAGERQLFAPGSSAFQTINFNQYYTSNGLVNPTVPGNLKLFPAGTSQKVTGSVTGVITCPAGSDGLSFYAGFNDGTNNLYVSATGARDGIKISPFKPFLIGGGFSILAMIDGYADTNINPGVFVGMKSGAGGGIWHYSQQAGSALQYGTGGGSNEGVVAGIGHSMAILNTAASNAAGSTPAPAGNIYYIKDFGNTGSSDIRYISAASTTSTPTTLASVPHEYGYPQGIWSSTNRLVYVSYAEPNNAPGQSQSPFNTWVWQTDGSTSGQIIANLAGTVIGGGAYEGTVYLVAVIPQSFNTPEVGQPIATYSYAIYSVDASGNVSTFDDTRDLDYFFQAQLQPNTFPFGGASVLSDGRYLWVSIPGAPVRFYDLAVSNQANPVFQYLPFPAQVIYTPSPPGQFPTPPTLIPTITSSTLALAGERTGFGPLAVHLSASTTMYAQQACGGQPSGGIIALSWMDFGAPTTVKKFKSVTIELVQALPGNANVIVFWQVEHGALGTATSVVDGTGSIVVTLPPNIKGYRIQVILQLLSDTTAPPFAGPIIRSVAVKATLGRAWKIALSCVRNQQLRNTAYAPGEDPQGLRAQEKLANIINVYEAAAGSMTMFIPSPTCTAPGQRGSSSDVACADNGVEVINCVLEDYQWVAGLEQPGPYNAEYGSLDQEGYMQLTIVESI